MADTKRAEWDHPGYPPLTGEVREAAVNGQIIKYPQVTRGMVDPPIANQAFTNMSFMLFKEVRTTRTGKKVYGFVKARGTWPNEQSCTDDAERIVAEVDSKFQVRIAPSGGWVPITDEDGVCADLLDVGDKNVNGESIDGLRDAAQKEKEKESRRIQNEIQEREEQVKKGGDIYDAPFAIEFYVMNRVTEMHLSDAIRTAEIKIAAMKEKQTMVHRKLTKLERVNPQYSEEWIDRYNVTREEAGLPDFVASSDRFKEFEAYEVPDDLSEADEDELRGYSLDENDDGEKTVVKKPRATQG